MKSIGMKPIEEQKDTHAQPLHAGQRNRLFALYALALCAWLGFWWLIRLSFDSSALLTTDNLWRVTGAFVLFGLSIGLFGLVASLVRLPRWGMIYAGVIGLVPFVFFPINLFTLAGALLVSVVWFRYWSMVTEESQHRIKYNLVKSVTHGLGTIIMFSVLTVAIMYLALTSHSNQSSRQFINNVTNSATDAVLVVLENQLPEFERSMTMDEFLVRFSDQDITSLLPENFLPEDVDESLLEEEQRQDIASLDETARAAALEEARAQLLQALNIEARGDETMEVIVGRLVEDKLGPLLEQYEHIIPPALALALFSVLSILGIVYFWWAVLWAAIWYGILRILRWVEFTPERMDVIRGNLRT